MNTKLATSQIRLKNWAAIIQDRKQSGLSVNDYCSQHQLSRDAYYYWLPMLNDADISRFRHVYVFVGKTDLRKGIDGLSTLVKQKFQLDPFQTGNLFLFCGSSNRKIKGLLWEEDGFLLLYKWLEAGAFQWPRSEAEARDITAEQYRLLMTGYAIDPSVHKIRPKHSM